MFDAPDLEEVNAIASDPDTEHVVLVPGADAVTSASSQLLDKLCL